MCGFIKFFGGEWSEDAASDCIKFMINIVANRGPDSSRQ